jgi:hypothetical protein
MMAVLVVNENEPPEKTCESGVEYSRVRIVKMAQERGHTVIVRMSVPHYCTVRLPIPLQTPVPIYVLS